MLVQSLPTAWPARVSATIHASEPMNVSTLKRTTRMPAIPAGSDTNARTNGTRRPNRTVASP